MNYKILSAVLGVLVLFFGFSYFSSNQPLGAASGAAHYQVESFLQGLTGGARDQFSVSNTGKLTTGNVVVTTSNTATSTLTVGCIQFYATSTATAQKFMASTTPGVMYSQYGTCP